MATPSISLIGPKNRANVVIGCPIKVPVSVSGVPKDKLEVSVRDPENVQPAKLIEFNDLTSVLFTPNATGLHHIDVKVDGKHLPGSPIPLQIKPGPKVSLSNTVPTFPLKPISFPLELQGNFKPQSLIPSMTDSLGKPIPNPVTINPNPKISPSPFNLTFVPTQNKTHVVHLTLEGDLNSAVADPIPIKILRFGKTPTVSLIGSSRRMCLISGQTTVFPVSILPDVDPLNVVVSVKHSTNQEAIVSDVKFEKRCGVYQFSFIPPASGKYTVDFNDKKTGNAFGGSPLDLEISVGIKWNVLGLPKEEIGVIMGKPILFPIKVPGLNDLKDVKVILRDGLTGAKSGEVKILPKGPDGQLNVQVIPHNFGPHVLDFVKGGVVLGAKPNILNLCDVFGASVALLPTPPPEVKIPGISIFPSFLKNVLPTQLNIVVEEKLTGKLIDHGTIIEDNGAHKLLFNTPKEMGVNVKFNYKPTGLPIKGSPLPLQVTPYKINLLNNPKVIPMAAQPVKLNFDIPGLKVGDLPNLDLKLNKFDNNVSVPMPNFQLTPLPDLGKFELKFNPEGAGKYQFDLNLNGEPLLCTPVTLDLAPEPTTRLAMPGQPLSLLDTIPFEDPFSSSIPLLDKISPFNLSAPIKDATNNKLLDTIVPTLKDDGSLQMDFVPKTTGNFLIDLNADGLPTDMSIPPVSVVVVDKPTVMLAGEPKKENCWAGAPCSFPIASVGVDNLKVEVKDPTGKIVPDVVLSNNPQLLNPLQLSFTPKTKGKYNATFLDQDGKPISGSPISLDILPPPNVKLLKPDPNSNSTPKPIPNQPFTIAKVSAPKVPLSRLSVPFQFDKLQDPLLNLQKDQLPKLTKLGQLIDNKDGTYDLQVTPEQIGKHVADVLVDGVPVGASLNFDCVDPLDFAKVNAGKLKSPAVVGEDCTIPVLLEGIPPENVMAQVKDPNGTVISAPTLVPSSTPNKLPLGESALRFVPKVPGKHLVELTSNGQPIKGSPLPVMVTPGAPVKVFPDTKNIPLDLLSLAPPVLSPPGVPSFIPIEFDKIPTDLKSLQPQILTPQGIVPAKLTPLTKDGKKQLLEFTPKVPGEHQLQLSVDGSPLLFPIDIPSPNITVKDAPLSAAKFNSIPVVVGGVKDVNTVKFAVKDESGQPVPVQTFSPNNFPSKKLENDVSVGFRPQHPGKYLLEATVDNKPLRGSPHNFEVGPALAKLIGQPKKSVPQLGPHSNLSVPISLSPSLDPEKISAVIRTDDGKLHAAEIKGLTDDSPLRVQFAPLKKQCY